MSLFIWIIIFVVSLAVLIKAADYFTRYSEKIGLALGIPAFIVGVTIVSIGTSLPELASSIAAVMQGQTEIVIANAVGSNIANILLIVGIAALFARKLIVKRDLINLDAPLLACVTGMAVFMIWDGKVNWIEAIFLVGSYLVYALYTVFSRDKNDKKEQKKPKFKIAHLVIILVSAVFIYLGAKYTIDAVIEISNILNINSSIIALSAVAIGTSLPELLVSVMAAKRGNYEMALGNVFGSNIFNLTMVIGVPAFITELEVSSGALLIAVPFLILATVLYIISGISKKIHNWEGAMYLIIYGLFIVKLLGIV